MNRPKYISSDFIGALLLEQGRLTAMLDSVNCLLEFYAPTTTNAVQQPETKPQPIAESMVDSPALEELPAQEIEVTPKPRVKLKEGVLEARTQERRENLFALLEKRAKKFTAAEAAQEYCVVYGHTVENKNFVNNTIFAWNSSQRIEKSNSSIPYLYGLFSWFEMNGTLKPEFK